MTKWQPIETAPKDVVIEGRVIDTRPYRWKSYSPQARRQMHKAGRWQRMNDYGGWENCDPPQDWLPIKEVRDA